MSSMKKRVVVCAAMMLIAGGLRQAYAQPVATITIVVCLSSTNQPLWGVPVNLGSAIHFTILAGSAITSTGGGTINGDVGLSPAGGSFISLATNEVNGTLYAVDGSGPAGSVNAPGVLAAAKADLTTAYNEARDRTPVPAGDYFLNPGGGNIGGLSLVPGLYKFTSTASIMGADVTLTGGANDVWIFQIGTALTVGPGGRHVILVGGAQARNIFWQVGSSATIGPFADFKGTIMADQSITMDTSSTMEGRALARIAAVTFNGTNASLPMPEAPRFTHIFGTASNPVTAVLITTPYFLLTLETSPDLLLKTWTTIATDTPLATPWTFVDDNATTVATQRFYRAFITPY